MTTTFSPSSPSPILTDRTTAEVDWKCGMARWWYKEEAGGGIVPTAEADYFQEGRDIHEDLAFVAELPDPFDGRKAAAATLERFLPSTPSASDQITLERLTRRAGWVVAFCLFEEPRIREHFHRVSAERELVLERGPLWYVCTPDRLLERKTDSRLVYKEYKSTKYANKGWVDYWPRAIQLHIGLKAAQEEYGRDVAYGQVMGLMKGAESYGKLHHPYVWAFRDTHTGEWAPAVDGQRQTKDLTPTPVWEYDGGIIEWVERLGKDVALGQLPHSNQVFLDERMLDLHVQSRTRRELEVLAVRDAAQADWNTRAEHFEPRTCSCSPQIGSPCAYLAACWNHTVRANPLASGLYKRRDPHHELEVLARGEEE